MPPQHDTTINGTNADHSNHISVVMHTTTDNRVLMSPALAVQKAGSAAPDSTDELMSVDQFTPLHARPVRGSIAASLPSAATLDGIFNDEMTSPHGVAGQRKCPGADDVS